ncbi:hypothetical protein BDV93DRAFT_221989 [Ceratobasidium sp. AG-I]|nr:hypothetical protein BDV93DRAFT_221989 [Ceratobasidium sp. AG-I]
MNSIQYTSSTLFPSSVSRQVPLELPYLILQYIVRLMRLMRPIIPSASAHASSPSTRRVLATKRTSLVPDSPLRPSTQVPICPLSLVQLSASPRPPSSACIRGHLRVLSYFPPAL